MMKIAIDSMGGDFAPQEIVKGSVIGAREYGVGIILVGPKDTIQDELAKYDISGLDIEIVHTDEYLVEGEQAAYALRKKRNASILLATKLVKDGKAVAVIGVGPTGGVFASALQVLGTLEGISRPVIGGQFLGFAPESVMIDLGGNVDSRPDQLLDFGIIGMVYARKWMNIPNPTVALVSNGAEEGKGNEIVKQTYELFKKSGLNFIGNVEGNDVAHGKANVIVCDGFIGNVIGKFCEGLGDVTARWLVQTLQERLPLDQVNEIVTALKRATIPADASGGGPLWGVNGIICKAHGRSKAPEVARTIGTAKKAVEIDLVGTFKTELATIRKALNNSNSNS
jgi:glycerol-3-phosphate acyltransferase PlsX